MGGQWRGEGAEPYHGMINVLDQPTPCCSCSLQSLGTSGVGSLDFAQVGGGGTPAASSHHAGGVQTWSLQPSPGFRRPMVCVCVNAQKRWSIFKWSQIGIGKLRPGAQTSLLSFLIGPFELEKMIFDSQ